MTIGHARARRVTFGGGREGITPELVRDEDDAARRGCHVFGGGGGAVRAPAVGCVRQ